MHLARAESQAALALYDKKKQKFFFFEANNTCQGTPQSIRRLIYLLLKVGRLTHCSLSLIKAADLAVNAASLL